MIDKTIAYHILTIFFLLQYTSVVNGDEKQKAERGTVEFFEKIYNIKISGVSPSKNTPIRTNSSPQLLVRLEFQN